MNNKYYFISYRININSCTPIYDNELIDITPFEYVLYHKDLGGDYQDRVILYSEEITEYEYALYKDKFDV